MLDVSVNTDEPTAQTLSSQKLVSHTPMNVSVRKDQRPLQIICTQVDSTAESPHHCRTPALGLEVGLLRGHVLLGAR
jgi:hypothetical protein